MYGKSNLWEQQRIKEIKLLFLLVLKFTVCFAKVLDSSDLDDTCFQYDSCSQPKYFRTCSCDVDCSKYGTCCRDAPERENYSLEQFECYTKDVSATVFVRQSCKPSYAGDPDAIAACESDQQDWSDLMANVLVSSNRTWITYKNWNCAICNEESVKNLWFWTVQASYPLEIVKNRRLSYKDLRQNLVFNAMVKQWGVYDDVRFINCHLQYIQPTHLHGELRYCTENLTSNCSRSWEGESIRQKCHSSYYGERKGKIPKTYFKNVYCALCNGLDIADLDCSGQYYSSIASPGTSMSMRIVYNLNQWTGEHTESYKSCSPDFKYDPFLKMCRNAVCGLKHPKKFNNYCEASGSDRSNTHYMICLLFVVFHLIASV